MGGVNAFRHCAASSQPIMMPPDEMVAMLFWSLRNLVTIPEGTNVGTVWISTWVAQVFCKRLTPEASGPAGRVRLGWVPETAALHLTSAVVRVGMLCVMFLTRVAGPTGNAFL